MRVGFLGLAGWCLMLAWGSAGCAGTDGAGRDPGGSAHRGGERAGMEYDRETPGHLMVMIPGREAVDSNVNGSADLVPLELLLFATDGSTEAPLWVRGRLTIEMQTLKEEQVLRRWELDEDQVDAARTMSQFGRTYRISVSMLDGTEQADGIPATWVRVVCRFTPAGSEQALEARSPSVLIGKSG